MYYFTKLAIELNEPEEGVAPTDSRLRPDQRLMEEGKWNEANELKVKIEEKQRAVRRQRELLEERALQKGISYHLSITDYLKRDTSLVCVCNRYFLRAFVFLYLFLFPNYLFIYYLFLNYLFIKLSISQLSFYFN